MTSGANEFDEGAEHRITQSDADKPECEKPLTALQCRRDVLL